jgi:hypothetical protein
VNLEHFKDEVIKKYRELGHEGPSQSAADAQKTGKKWVFFDDLVGDEDLSQQLRESSRRRTVRSAASRGTWIERKTKLTTSRSYSGRVGPGSRCMPTVAIGIPSGHG